MTQSAKRGAYRLADSPSNLKLFSIAVIVGIVGLSFFGYFVLQSQSEQSVRTTLFDQFKQRQVVYSMSVAKNIESDLNLLMSKLETVALSVDVQRGGSDSPAVEELLQQVYEDGNRISEIDGVYIIDENDVVVNYYNPKIESSQVIGFDASELQPVIEYRKSLPNPTFTNAYTSDTSGVLQIALIYPIYNTESGEYMGAAGIGIVLESFFQNYGNVDDINSQYFAALDNRGTVLVSAAKDIIGKDVFGEYVYNKHPDKSAFDHYRRVMDGSSSVAIFGFGAAGERINIGEPIILERRPTYSLFVVTPTAAIYTEMDKVLAAQRTETFILLAAISGAIALSIFFLVRWNNTLSKAVRSRTYELEQANRALETHDKLQTEFINIAAHELRTPVQPLLGAAEGLEDQILAGQEEVRLTKPEVDLILRNSKRLAQLTYDILEVSRIESNSLKLQKNQVNLHDKIARVIDDVRSFISDKDLKIVFEPKVNEPVIVQADKTKLFEVLSNILRNAIKFTDKGTIKVILDKSDSDAIVTVIDTGKGIDPDIMPKMFSRFASKSDSGTGLGLFIAKNIVEAHGGTISGENNPDGVGARFEFTLPLHSVKTGTEREASKG